jgi:para-nitrobenzyl esterase
VTGPARSMTVARCLAGQVRGAAIPTGVMFRGIPFAQPPVGPRRFLPPRPCPPWEGVRDCTAFGPVCPQLPVTEDVLAPLLDRQPADEDCLSLNVCTPAVDDGLRPVMVWIHGGAYLRGSGSSWPYDGEAFARDGIVTVSFNYRLHGLGFLYLDELFAGAQGTGNLGILDQIAALEWVRENIAGFGGDPGNVLVFGESAGAMSVGTLLGTPAASGLFRRAIAQSGAASHNLSRAAASRVAERVLDLLGVRPGDWEALRAVPVGRLTEVSTQVGAVEAAPLLEGETGGKMGFQPVVDGVIRPAAPLELVAAGSAAGVDLIVGTNAEEYRLVVNGPMSPDPDIAPYFAGSGRSVDEVLALYDASGRGESTRDLLCAVETDRAFTVPAVRLAEAQLRSTPNVWLYRFSWRTPVLGGRLGACHGLELPFVFATAHQPRQAAFLGADPPLDLARAMHAAWVRFAAAGDPSGPDRPAWPRYDTGARAVLNFDAALSLLRDPWANERRLWDGLPASPPDGVS